MTVTLSLPVLVSLVLFALLTGAGFMLLVMWLAKLSGRIGTLEAILHQQSARSYSHSSEMAVVE